jgi:hypothetical protein
MKSGARKRRWVQKVRTMLCRTFHQEPSLQPPAGTHTVAIHGRPALHVVTLPGNGLPAHGPWLERPLHDAMARRIRQPSGLKSIVSDIRNQANQPDVRIIHTVKTATQIEDPYFVGHFPQHGTHLWDATQRDTHYRVYVGLQCCNVGFVR